MKEDELAKQILTYFPIVKYVAEQPSFYGVQSDMAGLSEDARYRHMLKSCRMESVCVGYTDPNKTKYKNRSGVYVTRH